MRQSGRKGSGRLTQVAVHGRREEDSATLRMDRGIRQRAQERGRLQRVVTHRDEVTQKGDGAERARSRVAVRVWSSGTQVSA